MNNTTTTPTNLLPTHWQVYVNGVFSTIIATVAIVGNFAMIVVYCRYKKLRDLNNTAITYLSISDFSRACVVMTLKIHNQTTFVTSLNEPTCTITAFVCGFTFVFSPMLLALIGVVRYCKVVPPGYRTFELTTTMFYRAVICLVITATTFASLPIVGITGEYSYSPSHGVCFTDWRPINEIFRTIFYMLVIGLAFPVLIIFYTRLFTSLRKHYKGVQERTMKGYGNDTRRNTRLTELSRVKNSSSSDHVHAYDNCHINAVTQPSLKSSTNEPLQNKNGQVAVIQKDKIKDITPNEETNIDDVIKPNCSSRCNKITKQELQITNAMMLIVIAYCICWFPAAILNAVALYHKHTENNGNEIPLIYFYVIVTLVELKCALNPVIYGWGNRKYRNVFRAIPDVFRKKVTLLFTPIVRGI